MNELVVVNEVCSRCARPLCDGSGLCPDCDAPPLPATILPDGSPGQLKPGGPGTTVGLACLDNRWLVVALLLVAGPVGLPALWLSRRFSKGVKIGVSIAYAVATIGVPVALIWYWCEMSLRPLADALAR